MADTVKYLSAVFKGEEVTEADVLRLGLDGQLRLSVYFVNHAEARRGRVVSWDETDWWLLPGWDEFKASLFPVGGSKEAGKPITDAVQDVHVDGFPVPPKLRALLEELPVEERTKALPMMRDIDIGGGRFLSLDKRVITLSGIWDLPMIGSEQLDIEHQYQVLTGGPSVTLHGLDGVFVEGCDGEICQLQDRYEENKYLDNERRKKLREKRLKRPDEESHYPAGGLPQDAVIVVRTEALRELEQKANVQQNKPEKPLSTTEKNTLLTIIAALCEHSGIEIGDRGVPKRIANMTEVIGAPVDDETVRRWLKLVPDAVETRTK